MTGVRELTQQFHEAYERLAPSFGYETRSESAVPWDQVPEPNRLLMEAVVAEVVGPLLQRLAASSSDLTEKAEVVRRAIEEPVPKVQVVWDALAALDDILARGAVLETALRRIAEQQPLTLQTIESNGFVFTDIGQQPGNWQHLAFSIYTDLCEVDTIARGVLE